MANKARLAERAIEAKRAAVKAPNNTAARREAARAKALANAHTQTGTGSKSVIGGALETVGQGQDPTVLGRESEGIRVGQAEQIGAPTIDTSQADQFRTQQQGLATGLENTIAGTTPSVAQLQLQQQADLNAKQLQGQVAAQTTNAAQRARLTALGAANIGATTNQNAAILRAQEIATARGQLGDVLGNAQKTDLTTATNQAQMQANTNLANQAAVNNRNTQNAANVVSTQNAKTGAAGQVGASVAQANAQMYGANLNYANNQIQGIYQASDKNMKEDIKPGEEKTKSFLNSLKGFQFSYKGQNDPRLGVMAQDVEKSPMGKGMVVDGPQGKMIDKDKAFGAMLASLAYLHKKVDGKAKNG